jgi:hypothetical protein
VREHIFPASISNLNESLLLFKGEGKKKEKRKKKKEKRKKKNHDIKINEEVKGRPALVSGPQMQPMKCVTVLYDIFYVGSYREECFTINNYYIYNKLKALKQIH